MIREGFITNSSSTSFIFYGINFYQDDIGLEEDDFHYLLERIAKQPEPNIEHVYFEGGGRLIIFYKGAYLDLAECGIIDLPTDWLEKALDMDTETWESDLQNALDKWGIPSMQPRWRIALSIDI